MAKKITIQGSALNVTDTISSEVEISQPKKSTWYSADDLGAIDRISFYDTSELNGEFVYNPEICLRPLPSKKRHFSYGNISIFLISLRKIGCLFKNAL